MPTSITATAQNIALVSAAISLHILRCTEHEPETNKCDFHAALAELTLENANQSRAMKRWSIRIERLCAKYDLTIFELASAFDTINIAFGEIAKTNSSASKAVHEALTGPITKIGVITAGEEDSTSP